VRDRRQASLFLSISLLLLALMMVQSATGLAVAAEVTTRYVAQGGTDAGDCTVPGEPCATVQYAVDAAGSGDIIKIGAGLYSGVQGHPAPAGYVGAATVQQVAYVDKTVTLQGGYLAPDFADPPDPEDNQTTLDAQGAGRVLFIAGDVAPRIEGLRITGGDASGLGGGELAWQDAGGGVYILGADATLTGNWVYANMAEWYGGGLYLSGSNSLLEDNVISGNDATDCDWGHGGGLALVSSHARLCSNTVIGNRAGYRGGGLFLSSSNATLIGNIVNDNVSSSDGGGFCFLNSDAAFLLGNSISGNEAGIGGGLLLNNSDVTMRRNTVSGNVASLMGGGLAMWFSKPELDGNSISGNVAAEGGAGLDLSWYSHALLTSNLIADNRAGTGGCALCIQDSSPRLLHTTIVSNTGSGGAIRVTGDAAQSSIALTNTILISHTLGITVSAGNTATLEATFWGVGDWANDVDWGGEGIIDIGDINVRGDPGFTCTDGGCPAPYRLGPTSDALDEGVAAGVRNDIDGEPRLYPVPDLGADEYWPPGILRWVYLPVVLRSAP
jgi:hypothetical protein